MRNFMLQKTASMLESIYKNHSFETWLEKEAAWNTLRATRASGGRTVLDPRRSGMGSMTRDVNTNRMTATSKKGAGRAMYNAQRDSLLESGKASVVNRDTNGVATSMKGTVKALTDSTKDVNVYKNNNNRINQSSPAFDPKFKPQSKMEQMVSQYDNARVNDTRFIGSRKITGGDMASYQRQGIVDKNNNAINPFEAMRAQINGKQNINYNNIGANGTLSTKQSAEAKRLNNFVNNGFSSRIYSNRDMSDMRKQFAQQAMSRVPKQNVIYDDYNLQGDDLAARMSTVKQASALEKFASIYRQKYLG